MSDILGTAKLYTANNTFRSDTSGNTRGNARQDEGTRIGFDCSGLVYHVLRESGYNVPYAPSGVMQSDGNFTGSWATALNEKSAVSPGTLVYFNGHVGIVNSYNPETKTGTFLSMTGKNNEGSLKPEEPFTTDNKNTDPNITWGKTTAFKGFAAVNQNLYDPQLDQHANGANANTPVFNIPEARNAGFVTLPQNGGFPMLKEAKDLSALERITAANQGVTLLTGADAAKGTTPFAVTLANLESRGKPDDGYTAQQFDHDAKGNVLPGIGAIGRYGFRAASLKAIGWMDSHGDWTDAAKSLGVDSVDAFKDNPQAQEDARVAYIQVLKGELRNNGAWEKIGTTVDGEVVSEAGLIAAAWKEGSKSVAQFFNGNASANAETNIKFRFGEFGDVALVTGQESAGHGSGAAHSVSSNGTETPITPYNAMGDFPDAAKPVGVPGSISKPTTTGASSTGTHSVDPHAPYVARSIPTPNGDGTTTSTGVAIGNSSDGLIAKGDTVSAVRDADGKTLSEVIVHKTASGTAVTERIFDPNGGPPTETSTEIDKNGNVVYQMTTRDGQVLGDNFISDGVTYTRPAPGAGYDAWLDPNGHTQTERMAQGVKDSDAHILRYTTPPPKNQVASLDVPDPNTVLADYKQIDRDGVTYAVGPNGTLNRAIPGQPGLMELREADGSGYIVDTQAGTKLAVLRIGDHVDSNDSDRIVIFDDAGHAVDRATQDAPANVFAPMATTTTDAATAQIIDALSNPVVIPGGGVQLADAGTGTVSDAGPGITIPSGGISTGSASTSNTPIVPADTAQNAPKTVATTGSPLPPPIDTSGPDGSDAHLNYHPQTTGSTTSTPASTFAILRTPQTDAALQPVADGIGVINSLTALTHWGAQDDLGHLSSLVNLYTSLDRATGGQLPGDLGQVGGYLSLAQSLHNHDTLGVLSSVNSLGDNVVDNTLNSALGTSEVPYVGTLMALNNFDKHPGQSIGSIVGSLWGPAGSMIGSFIGGMLDGMFGGHAPPPPEGIVHYVLDEHGAVQVQAQSDISGGAAPAGHAAGQLLGVLQSVVDQQNAADHNANPGNNLAIDPSRLPRVGFDHEQVWIELTRPDGSIVREVVDPATVGQRMLQVALDNDALVPQWQIQTTVAHAQAPTPQPSAPSTSDAPDSGSHGETATPHASTGATPSAAPVHATQGHAVEAADHKSQTYDTLVVHLSPERSAQVQANIEAITEQAKDQHHANTNGQTVYRDADGDGYFEATQWVDALDEAGNAQGLLVLDRNHDGVIATADILHLGNASESNSVAWLDSNGDGKLDASDPAFAAIKIWTDINHDGKVDDGEEHGLQSLQLTSIDFTTGQINYGNGQSDTLSATTLTADTEGMKATALTEVGEDGKLHVVAKAGTVLVHEGYEGKVLVDGKGHILPDGQAGVAGAHWVEKRVNSLEHIATRTGDWEGTEEQAQHRHGEGGNAEGAPTETNATGATGKGAVLGKTNVTTATTMDVGDNRITSDAPAKASANSSSTNNKPTTITVNAGDARITSNPPQPKPVVFVPAGAREGWITEDGKALLQAPQDGLFSAGGMGALGVVVLGAVQQTAFAHTEPRDGGFTWQTTGVDISAGSNTVIPTTFRLSDDSTPAAAAPSGNVIHLEDFAVARQIHLGVPHVAAQPLPGAQPSYLGKPSTPTPYLHPANQLGASTPAPYLHPRVSVSTQSPEEATQQCEPATLYIAPRNLPTGTPGNDSTQPTDTASTGNTSTAPTDSTTTNPTNPSTPGASSTPPTTSTTTTPPIQAPIDTTPTAPTLNSATTGDDHLNDPQEDTVLRVSVATLLANDTNATGIAQVGNAEHGTVVLQGSEVVFTPEANYHGPASFAYVVSGQDGGRAAGVASFTISAVNDVPVAANESVNASEDVVATITQATLLANDTDVDTTTDGQTLRVSAVGHASHGTVNLVGSGSITFTPDANFHGTASFEYVVNDGNGGTATATATVQVAAVNDVPVALGETITSTEDTTLLLTQAALLANDTDADVATDGQVLTISAVSNATHGTVSILGNGQIQFVPVANYNGTATFDYVVSDGHGGTATATATVLVGSTDDAPVASGETVASSEDQTVTLTAAALLANDTDVDNTASELVISRVAAGTGGTVAINAGNVVFTPTANFNGTASFTYWVKDPAGLESNAATVTLNVAPVNDSPYAQGEVVSGASEDAEFHIDRSILLANDGDVEDSNGSLSIELVGNATHGTVSLDGSGNVVYTPTANFNGTATFQYQVRDSGGAVSPVVSADIAVAAVNDLPIGVDDQFQTFSDLPTLHSHATIGFNELVGNDLDVDNDPLTVSAVRNATNGSVAIVNGAVSFTPALGFSGLATFEYQVDDQHGGQSWAKAFITVKEPPNEYPTMSVVSVTHTPNYYFGLNEQLVSTATHASVSPADDGGTNLMSITYFGGSYTQRDKNDGSVSTFSLSTPSYSLTDVDVSIGFIQNPFWDYSGPLPELVSFETSWRVVDDRGLANIWHFSYSPTTGYQSSMEHTGFIPPVVLSLDGNAPHYIETAQSNVRFDLNGDGVADQVAWAAPGSGVLGIDLNGDHRITNASEFAFTQYTPGAKTDLEGLRAFDTNHNGVLDAADAQWGKFGVWEDKNSDGQTQEGEYQSLDQLGIASISLSGDKDTHTPVQVPSAAGDGHLSGVAVMGEASYTRTDGRSGVVHDAMFAFDADRELAEVRRMALQFNQFCNTAQSDHAPLGYVPIAAADDHGMTLPWLDGAGAHPSVRHEDVFA